MSAKKSDPFDKFREATLGSGGALSGALGSKPRNMGNGPSDEEPRPAAAKQSKNSDRTLVSFHIDKETFRRLGTLKFEMGTKYDVLYNEAVEDLLRKYGKL